MAKNEGTPTRRSIIRKSGALAGGLFAGATATGSSAADAGWSGGGGDDYGECVYSGSYSKCASAPYDYHGTTLIPTGCANLSTADILVGTGVCTLWIGAASADGFPGDEAVAWKTCGAGTVVCGIQRKLGKRINSGKVKKVERFRMTEDTGKFDKGDTVIKEIY